MLRDRNIAFFIDVDNVGLETDHYNNVVEQLNAMGKILLGVIYGAGERKHKEIYADADLHGYKLVRPMRLKRRGKKDFDSRILVDVVEAVNRAPAIDAVCIVAQPTDMVYLYAYLLSRGIKIIALDNTDDASCAFIDEVVDLGKLVEIKIKETKPKKAPAKKQATPAPAPVKVEEPAPAKKEEPAPAQDTLDRTDELLREIEYLRSLANAKPVEQPAKEPEPAPVEEQPASIVDETNALLDKIAEMKEPEKKAAEPAPAKQPAEPEKPATRASYSPQNDSDLIRRIEEIRKSNDGGDPDDLLDEIRKLLDVE